MLWPIQNLLSCGHFPLICVLIFSQKYCVRPKKGSENAETLVLVPKPILLFQLWSISGFEYIPKLDPKCCNV